MLSQDIEGILKWKGTKVKIYISSAKKWGTERASAALSRLRTLDAESKSGGVFGMAPIENFVAEFL
jgi:hypothetical protein